MDKSKCYDIFQKTKVSGMRMYSQDKTIKDVLKYSIEIKKLVILLKNIQLLKSLHPTILSGYNNLTFIQMTLR